MPDLPEDWRRYIAPVAFLLAVTIAVVLIRSGMESGGGSSASPPPRTSRPPTLASVSTTTTASKPHTTAKRYWTVKAGDTFGVISSETGVPAATIEQLNPTVKSTSLFIGEKIRIR
ncbi:MAG TPA: LysM domain-containing protein [Gaiellaceae bacterium]|nr:LysM domain-containing protein [Gaiellaceae bacterium]